MLENDNVARVLANQLTESLDSPPPILNDLRSTKFDSEPQYRAYLAHHLLLKRFDTSPSAESDENYVGSPNAASPELLLAPAQKLADAGFEDSLYAHPWRYRCQNRLVYANSASAHSGVNYLAANDSPRTHPNPSIYQDIYVGYDGRYLLDFGVHIRCAQPVPSDRRIILAIWQYTPLYINSKWTLRGSSPPISVTADWQRVSLQARSGGRFHRCEVYWHDDYPQDMNFDDCYCNVQKY